jgi:hypothetical protein
MKEDDCNNNQALSAAARTYRINGYLKLTNLFTKSEAERLASIYDDYHALVDPLTSSNGDTRIPPTGSLLENSPQLTELIFAKTELLNVLRAAAGADVQFAGSDAVHVYNDSIGIHRDTFYKYDFPKILIFLSDTPVRAKFNDPLEQRHGGAFLVLPGSHTLGDQYSARTSQMCHWPHDESEYYSYIGTDFTFVRNIAGLDQSQRHEFGRKLEQQKQNRSKYNAFAKIVFRKGDVVLFSTRALHALYPLFEHSSGQSDVNYKAARPRGSDYPKYQPLKLLGLLFIEGYSRHHSRTLDEAISAQDNSEDLIEYISTVYNLRLYNTIVDHGEAAKKAIKMVSGKPMGLNRNLSHIQSPEAKLNTARHNIIHTYYQNNSQLIDMKAGASKEDIHALFLKNLSQHDLMIKRDEEILEKTMKILQNEQPNLNIVKQKQRSEWQGLARYLPLIGNESAYLFYKKLARLIGYRQL